MDLVFVACVRGLPVMLPGEAPPEFSGGAWLSTARPDEAGPAARAG